MKPPRPTVRLDFCDFYPGFNKNDNFFINLLRQRFDVQITDKPDFLIYSQDGYQHRLHNCVKIFFTVEAYRPNFDECDYAFTCHHLDDPRHVRLPLYVIYATAADLDKGKDDFAQLLAQKTKFCSFVVSNSNKRKTQRRIEFFKKLNERQRVDSGGTFLNNIGSAIPGGPAGKLEFLKPYKFNIAFENDSLPGYTTEKIVEAMKARCVPVYWGNPRIHEEFNTGSFLNWADYGSDEALIEKMLELGRDDAQYGAMLRTPYLPSNPPNPWFDKARINSQFEKIFSTPLRPVARRRHWFRLGRWILVKRNQD